MNIASISLLTELGVKAKHFCKFLDLLQSGILITASYPSPQCEKMHIIPRTFVFFKHLQRIYLKSRMYWQRVSALTWTDQRNFSFENHFIGYVFLTFLSPGSRIEHFRSKIKMMHQFLCMCSDSEVCRSAWRSTFQETILYYFWKIRTWGCKTPTQSPFIFILLRSFRCLEGALRMSADVSQIMFGTFVDNIFTNVGRICMSPVGGYQDLLFAPA